MTVRLTATWWMVAALARTAYADGNWVAHPDTPAAYARPVSEGKY